MHVGMSVASSLGVGDAKAMMGGLETGSEVEEEAKRQFWAAMQTRGGDDEGPDGGSGDVRRSVEAS